MKAIFERRSVRKYTDKPVSAETIEEVLKAGMAAPSAGNERPWHFVVLDDKDLMIEITKVHQYSQMLKEASHAIVVCSDMNLKKYADDYWIQDCSAATENMLVMAQHLELGGVWLGVYPNADRVSDIKRILNLPDNIIPVSIVSLGYPAEQRNAQDRYDVSRVHWNKW